LKFGELFTRYEKEIDAMLDAYPPNVSGAPGAYEAAFQAVKAKHIDELILEEAEKKAAEKVATTTRRPAVAPPRTASAPTRAAAQEVRQDDGGFGDLGERERELLTAYGVTGEDYAKYADEDYVEDILGFKGRSRV
jgi:hypothetical protein